MAAEKTGHESFASCPVFLLAVWKKAAREGGFLGGMFIL